MLKIKVSSESKWKSCEMQGQCSCFKASLPGTLQKLEHRMCCELLVCVEDQLVHYRDLQSCCVWLSLHCTGTESLFRDEMHIWQTDEMHTCQGSLTSPARLGSVFDGSAMHQHRSFLETAALAASWRGGHKKSEAVTAGDAASYGT